MIEMLNLCPGPEVWVAWQDGVLGQAERARWQAHLAACGDCRAELASLVAAGPEPLSPELVARCLFGMRLASRHRAPLIRRVPYAAAAGFLLVASLLAGWAWRTVSRPGPSRASSPDRPSSESLPTSAPEALAWQSGEVSAQAGAVREILVGANGELVLDRGARGRLANDPEGVPVFRLEAGSAWVESGGAPLLLRIGPEGEGFCELTQGVVAARAGDAPPPALSFLVSAAWAEDETASVWSLTLVQGEAFWVSEKSKGQRRRMSVGETLGSPNAPPPAAADPRAWHRLEGGPFSIKDGVLTLVPSGGLAPRAPYAAEVLIRKRSASAEAALLFSAAGGFWQAPLGVHLPASRDWARLRIEAGGERVRILAGSGEMLSATPRTLSSLAYPVPESGSWDVAMKAWGGDVEVKEVRWRVLAP